MFIKASYACLCPDTSNNCGSDQECYSCGGHVSAYADDYDMFHTANQCVGNCEFHSLARLGNEATIGGLSWASVVEMELEEKERCETPIQREAKLELEKAEAEQRSLQNQASRMYNYSQDQKNLNMRGKGRDRHVNKLDSPCKWLFCDETVPKKMWATNARGEKCAPVLNHLTGAQCWAHEYQDPKTKAWLKPHSCKYLHPNEDGWRDEWDENRCFKIKPIAIKNKNYIDASAW